MKLAVKALMEVVESPKNIEIAIVKKGVPLRFLEVDEIETLVDALEKEQKEKEGQ